MRGLTDKVAIIAGAATGIGKATAVRLANAKVALALGDTNSRGVEAVAEQIIKMGGRAIAVACDISDEASVKALVDCAVAAYGGVDFMHANAADLSLTVADTDVVDVALDLFDRTIAVNLRGHFLCTRYVVPEFQKRGRGAIVYTTSAAAFAGEPERVSYAMSKSGIHALMRHVASRWGKDGVRSNAVAPGFVLTEQSAAKMPMEMQIAIAQLGRSPRLGQAEDIAAMVAFLFSDEGEWINGQVISVDGGVTMR